MLGLNDGLKLGLGDRLGLKLGLTLLDLLALLDTLNDCCLLGLGLTLGLPLNFKLVENILLELRGFKLGGLTRPKLYLLIVGTSHALFCFLSLYGLVRLEKALRRNGLKYFGLIFGIVSCGLRGAVTLLAVGVGCRTRGNVCPLNPPAISPNLNTAVRACIGSVTICFVLDTVAFSK